MNQEKENDIQIMMVQLLVNKKPQSPTADQLRKCQTANMPVETDDP